MKIGIRADGGQDIGIGHIQRCLALSSQLKKKKAEIVFIIKRNRVVKEKLVKERYNIIELGSNLNLEEDLKSTLDIIKRFGLKTLITDSYKIDTHYLNEIKKNVDFLVSIDDLAEISFSSDIVINQNIYAKNLKYYSLTDETKFLLGPEYALLGEEFSNIKKRKISKEVKNILITLGGTDRFNLTPKILNILDKIEEQFKITVVIGPFFKNVREIKDTVKKMRKIVNLIDSSPDMVELMLSSDLTITAGGITLYELACTGTPAIAFRVTENQLKNIKGMSKAGIIIDAGLANNFNKKDFKEKVKNLLTNFSLQKVMSEKGQKLVDGRGSLRCANKIYQLSFSNKK